jgi:hypothetical protein
MPRKKPPSDKAKEQFWRKAIERQLQSGLTQPAFCEREHLSLHTFAWWKRQIAQRDLSNLKEAAVADEAIFIPVAHVSSNAPQISDGTKSIAEIDLVAGVIRIFAGIDRYALHEVIAAFREVTR